MGLFDTLGSALRPLARRRELWPVLWALGALAVLAGQGSVGTSWLRVEPRALGALQDALAGFLLALDATLAARIALGLLVIGALQSAAGALLHGALIALVAQAWETPAGAAVTLPQRPAPPAPAEPAATSPAATPSAATPSAATPIPPARPAPAPFAPARPAPARSALARAALARAARRWWPLFLVRFLIGVSILAPALLVLAVLLGVLAFAAAGADLQQGARLALVLVALCLLPVFALVGLSALVLGWIEALALRSCVLEDAGVLAAMRRGWRLLRARPLAIVLLWATTTLLDLAGGGLVGLLAGALGAPGVTRLVLAEPLDAGSGLPLALAAALVLAAGGALTALNSALWTAGYRALAAVAPG
jgi:hypothetical protein